MAFKSIRIWHPMVHHRLRERLYYFIIKVEDFFGEKEFPFVLERFLCEQGISSYCLYPVFGVYDMLARVWMNPIRFSTVADYLSQETSGWASFGVRSEGANWAFEDAEDRTTIRQAIAELVTSERILAAQNGDAGLRKVFDEAGLWKEVPSYPSEKSIKFYIAVSKPSAVEQAAQNAHLARLRDILTGCEEVENKSVYAGEGFAWVLLKGTSEQYYPIGQLAERVSRAMVPFQCYTTTFLITTNHITEQDVFSRASFHDLEAWYPEVDAWIPEVYSDLSLPPDRRRAVEACVRDVAGLPMAESYRKRLRRFLLAAIHGEWEVASDCAIGIFAAYESDLRERLGRLASAAWGAENVGPRLAERGLPTSIKEMMLRQLFAGYNCIHSEESPVQQFLPDRPDEIERMRNRVAHGRLRADDWENEWCVVSKALAEIAVKAEALTKGTAP